MKLELLAFIIGCIIPLGMMIGVYVKMRISIAEITVEITNFRHELLQKELALQKLEKDNKDDHFKISEKLDQLILKLL